MDMLIPAKGGAMNLVFTGLFVIFATIGTFVIYEGQSASVLSYVLPGSWIDQMVTALNTQFGKRSIGIGWFLIMLSVAVIFVRRYFSREDLYEL